MAQKKLMAIGLFLSATAVFAATDAQIEKFTKKLIEKNPGVRVASFEAKHRVSIKSAPGWEAVAIKVKISTADGKNPVVDSLIFTKGDLITSELVNAKTGEIYNFTVRPPLDKNAFNKKNLIIGTGNEANKIVIFSDPLCPFCQDFVPNYIKGLEKRKDVAVYFVDLPLLIHPASNTIVKMMYAAAAKGMPKTEIIKKFYSLSTNPALENENKIIAAVNKELNLTITANDIHKPEIEKHLKMDKAIAKASNVSGTPNIYVNGKFDGNHSEIRKLSGYKKQN